MNKKQHLITSPEVIDQKDKAKVHTSKAESWIDLREKKATIVYSDNFLDENYKYIEKMIWEIIDTYGHDFRVYTYSGSKWVNKHRIQTQASDMETGDVYIFQDVVSE
jgi:hypothetical protein